MTRKSQRELERALDDLDDDGDAVGYLEMMRYLETVADDGVDAETPREYFDANREWGPWADILPTGDVLDVPGLEDEDLTPPELFGLRYCDQDVVNGVLAMRGAGRDV